MEPVNQYQISLEDSLVRYLKSRWVTNNFFKEGPNAFQDLVQSDRKLSTDLRRALRSEMDGLQTFNGDNINPIYSTWTILAVAWLELDLAKYGIQYTCDGNPTPPHSSVWLSRSLTKVERSDLIQILVTESEGFIGVSQLV